MLRRKLAALAAAATMTIALSGAQAQAAPAPFMDYTDDACMEQIIAVLIGFTAPIGSNKGSLTAPLGSTKGS
jgi:hypothetical protein